MVEYILETHESGGSVTASSAQQEIGRIVFDKVGPGVLDLIHTEVFPEWEGQGYGSRLVNAAVDHARSSGMKLRASCPFALRVLKRNPNFHDIFLG